MIDAIKRLVDTLYNTTALAHHQDSRSRVYPQVAGATITLISDGTADTFGSWTEIIPIDTVDFEYKIKGLNVYGVDATASYFMQLGYSIVGGSDPTTAQITGEREISIISTPVAKATELLDFFCESCPANAKLWGRLKTDNAATDEAYVTVVVLRHIPTRHQLDQLVTWPWST